jgi:hypothetical protein
MLDRVHRLVLAHVREAAGAKAAAVVAAEAVVPKVSGENLMVAEEGTVRVLALGLGLGLGLVHAETKSLAGPRISARIIREAVQDRPIRYSSFVTPKSLAEFGTFAILDIATRSMRPAHASVLNPVSS